MTGSTHPCCPGSTCSCGRMWARWAGRAARERASVLQHLLRVGLLCHSYNPLRLQDPAEYEGTGLSDAHALFLSCLPTCVAQERVRRVAEDAARQRAAEERRERDRARAARASAHAPQAGRSLSKPSARVSPCRRPPTPLAPLSHSPASRAWCCPHLLTQVVTMSREKQALVQAILQVAGVSLMCSSPACLLPLVLLDRSQSVLM